MTARHYQGANLMPIMAAAFPNAFFADPRQVQPLKIDIHRDIAAARPEGVTPFQVGRFLYWYVSRLAYQRALAQGRGRIDLTGVVVDAVIPDAIREQARERWRALRAQRTARQQEAAGPPNAARPRPPPSDTPPAAPRAEPRPKATRPAASPPMSLLNLEELYAVATDAKLEVTLKFSTLPEAKPAGAGKMAFALKTPNGPFVVAEIGAKLWAKLVKANADWPAWIAALTGTMGERTEKGFVLANPGLQVFEKKPKAAADAPAPTATAPSPASPPTAEPVASPRPPPAAPPSPAPPVIVTTGAGTATVTTRKPLSLKRNASTKETSG